MAIRGDRRQALLAELVSACLRLYATNLKLLASISFLVWAPIFGVEFIAGLLLGLPSRRVVPNVPDANRGTAVALAVDSLLVVILTLVGAVLSQGALIKAVADRVAGQAVTTRAALAFARARFVPLLGLLGALFVLLLAAEMALFLVGLVLARLVGFAGGLAGGSAAALSVGIVIMVGALLPLLLFARVATAGPVVVLEGTGPIESLRRAYSIQTGRYWNSLLLLLAVSFAGWIVSTIVNLMLGWVGGGTAVELAAASALEIITAALFASLPAVVVTSLYFDAVSASGLQPAPARLAASTDPELGTDAAGD